MVDTDLGLQVENGFSCAVGGRDHLRAVKADEVGLLGVILHEAHSPTMLLGPALSSRGHRQVQLNNCGGQCLGGESRAQWSLTGQPEGLGARLGPSLPMAVVTPKEKPHPGRQWIDMKISPGLVDGG